MILTNIDNQRLSMIFKGPVTIQYRSQIISRHVLSFMPKSLALGSVQQMNPQKPFIDSGNLQAETKLRCFYSKNSISTEE